jgi:uncharacterized protein
MVFMDSITKVKTIVNYVKTLPKSVKIALTGASGLVGSHLSDVLENAGYSLVKYTRKPTGSNQRIWDPNKDYIDSVDDIDVFVHLGGENISSAIRWTSKKKKRIRDSRVNGTRVISSAIIRSKNGPKILISASAIGIYKSIGAVSNETSEHDNTFLSGVVSDWERALNIDALKEKGVRVVVCRLGVVLSKDGGMLKRLLLPFKLGVGGRVGSGNQHLSWISIRDVIAFMIYAIGNNSVGGVYNVVSPDIVKQIDFAKTLSSLLKRPCLFPLPAFLVKIIMGEMGNELLLKDVRISSEKLKKTGFLFSCKSLKNGLEVEL